MPELIPGPLTLCGHVACHHFACGWRLAADARMNITDEMVEAGADALFQHNVTGMALWRQDVARAVITAALGQNEQREDTHA